MMDTIMVIIVIAVVVALVYFVVNKMIGNEEGTAPCPGGTQKKFAPNGFEKPLPSAVTVSCPLWLYFFGVLAVPLGILGIFLILGGDDVFSGEAHRMIFVLLCLVFIPFAVGLLNTEYICDHIGITVKSKVYLAFFVVINKNTLIPWHDFISVDYCERHAPRGGTTRLFEFRTASGDKFNVINIVLSYKNSRDALALAVKYIDSGKFTMKAQERLKKMGIWP